MGERDGRTALSHPSDHAPSGQALEGKVDAVAEVCRVETDLGQDKTDFSLCDSPVRKRAAPPRAAWGAISRICCRRSAPVFRVTRPRPIKSPTFLVTSERILQGVISPAEPSIRRVENAYLSGLLDLQHKRPSEMKQRRLLPYSIRHSSVLLAQDPHPTLTAAHYRSASATPRPVESSLWTCIPSS